MLMDKAISYPEAGCHNFERHLVLACFVAAINRFRIRQLRLSASPFRAEQATLNSATWRDCCGNELASVQVSTAHRSGPRTAKTFERSESKWTDYDNAIS